VEAVAGLSELLLTTTPQEVSVARGFAVTAIARLGGDEEAQDRVRTLVSELVTNVVLHAETPAVLTVRDDGDCVWVLVTDGSPAPARQRRPGAESTTGRGLWLLQTLSADSGTWPSTRIGPAGKTVWFTVRKHTRSAEQQALTASALALFDVDLEAWTGTDGTRKSSPSLTAQSEPGPLPQVQVLRAPLARSGMRPTEAVEALLLTSVREVDVAN